VVHDLRAEIAVAHAASYPSRANDYGPNMRGYLAEGTRVTMQQFSVARA
jgi:hypothetical protein